MSNVRTCLSQKANILYSVSPDDSVKDALQKMRDNRVRAILVIEGGELVGIVSQGDCAIKVLLPGKHAGDTLIRSVMPANPITVSEADELDHFMAILAPRDIHHLPLAHCSQGVGAIAIGDIVKNIILPHGDQDKFL